MGSSNITSVQVTCSAVNKSYSGPTATGTGTASVIGGGDRCGFESNTQFVPLSTVAAPPPAGYAFPHGLFKFTLSHCTIGATVTLTIQYPTVLPAGAVYMKYGPTPDNRTPHWYPMPATLGGNTATFQVTDGGLGDDDLTANGTLIEPGGPAVPAATTDIPTLSEWAMLALLMLLLGIGITHQRRHR